MIIGALTSSFSSSSTSLTAIESKLLISYRKMLFLGGLSAASLSIFSFFISIIFFCWAKETYWPMTISLIDSRDTPSNGYWPTIIAYIRTPSAHMSIFGSLALSPCKSSGDIYFMLPALWRSANVPRLEPKIPKSAILTCTFEGAFWWVGSSSTLLRRITF